MKSTRLFVYGSLMFPEVWERLVEDGARHRRVAAAALGYSAFRVEGESYPGLVEAEGGVANGVLIFDLSVEDWDGLDAFEGEFYKRQGIQVRSGAGENFSADTYLVAAGFRDRLSDELWDADVFASKGLGEFIARFVEG